jgi:NAD-dependent dihydropyrimidine dehydrogenase PreA subunit/flavodoxin
MPSTLIHYFTGTGNTAHAVNLMKKRLEDAGHLVTIIQVSQGINPPTDQYEYHIVAFPILSWAAPTLMKKYLKRMPVTENGKVAILAINGAVVVKGKLVDGFTGQGLEEAESLLKRKGYDVFLTGNASFPDNWTQMTNPCSKEDSAIIISSGEKSVHFFLDEFLNGKRNLFRCGGFHKVWSTLIAWLFGRIGRKVLGTFYIADEHCTGCAFCAKTCPVQTIEMKKDLPFWKTRCEDCNRCINICPEKAIQVSMPLLIIQLSLNLVLTILSIYIVVWFTSGVLSLSGFWELLINIVLIPFSIWLGYQITLYPLASLFGWLMQKPRLRPFFSKSFTKNFRRYHAPGYIPGKKLP